MLSATNLILNRWRVDESVSVAGLLHLTLLRLELSTKLSLEASRDSRLRTWTAKE